MTIEETRSSQPSAAIDLERRIWPSPAGFWRRLAAFLIDYLIIFVPLFAVVATLFSLTNGAITGSFSLTWKICYPASMDAGGHPTLAEYDWSLCRTSLFGLTVAEWTQGAPKAAAQPNDSSLNGSAGIAYALDPEGNIRPSPLDVGFLEWVALFIYLLVMEIKFGDSIGKRILLIAVHDDDDFDRVGLPRRKAVRRQAMKFLGTFPTILLSAWYSFHNWGAFPVPLQAASTPSVILGFSVFLVAFIWAIWIAASIVFSRNPVHDRFAETSVRMHPLEAGA